MAYLYRDTYRRGFNRKFYGSYPYEVEIESRTARRTFKFLTKAAAFNFLKSARLKSNFVFGRAYDAATGRTL